MNAPVRSFGKYLLDQEIARGGMSRVFAARLRGVGGFEKRLVVKQVLPELARDPRFVSMFVHEANTLVQMSHPHIAPVFELGIVDGVYFLAMEYVDGATLAAILQDGPLAPELAAHLGVQICDALHYAHTRFDIVHRDVTPRNVIVDGDGHCRLLDFGVAAPLDGEAELFGTPGYLAPEQLEGAIDAASDVFALGAVLYEALTGRRAFPAQTVEEMREALGDRPAFDARVPAALGAIVEKALARDPGDRFASARALGRALRGWLASAHPEGVAPELGLRAERAERDAPPASEPDEVTPATREVRTLATRAIEPVEKATAAIHADERRQPIHALRGVAALALVAIVAIAGALAWPRAPIEARPEPASPSAPPPPVVARPAPVAPIEAPPPSPAPAIEQPPTPAPRPMVALSVNASPWAEVELDGRSLGRTPQRRISIRSGRHVLVLRCPPLGRELRHVFDAEPGHPLVLVADLTAEPPTVRRR